MSTKIIAVKAHQNFRRNHPNEKEPIGKQGQVQMIYVEIARGTWVLANVVQGWRSAPRIDGPDGA